MNTKAILSEINNCIVNADFSGLEKNIKQLLKSTSEAEASKSLADLLYNNYSQLKSGFMAKVMEIIIRTNPNLAYIKHPQNFLFNAAVLRGSTDMYECYIEEAVIPFLSLTVPDEHEIHYMELLNAAQQMSDYFFKDYQKYSRGLHYNGTFSKLENDENVVLMHKEDYDTLQDIAEKYNTIIGRKDIIKDLNKRAGLDI